MLIFLAIVGGFGALWFYVDRRAQPAPWKPSSVEAPQIVPAPKPKRSHKKKVKP